MSNFITLARGTVVENHSTNRPMTIRRDVIAEMIPRVLTDRDEWDNRRVVRFSDTIFTILSSPVSEVEVISQSRRNRSSKGDRSGFHQVS